MTFLTIKLENLRKVVNPAKEDLPRRERSSSSASSKPVVPASLPGVLACYRATLPRSDFPQSAFRAEHDPFDEQAVVLLRRFETAFRRKPEDSAGAGCTPGFRCKEKSFILKST